MNKDQAWEIQHRFPNPGGYIQWKGTEVCFDWCCVCGYPGHFDGGFMYYLRCPECKRVFMCNGSIQLIEITEGLDELDAIQEE